VTFYQHYPQLADSIQARYQFYETSWRRVLMEMIDHELILTDAADKEVKLSDAEVREEIDHRFGPNVMTTLSEIGIPYDEAWKMVKDEMIVTRMNWWFVQSKAMIAVTPQIIRQGYRLYLKENPARKEWKYRVLTFRGDDESVANEFYQLIETNKVDIEGIPNLLEQCNENHPFCKVTLSNEFVATDAELSESHRMSLSAIEPHGFSSPVSQVSRDRQKVTRIFYLAEKTEIPIPTFEQMSIQIKNELLQKKSMEMSTVYLNKLRKHYRFDLQEVLSPDLQPFSLQ